MARKAEKQDHKRTAATRNAGSAEPVSKVYVLKLCISGMSPRSRRAIENIKRICEEYLQGQYQLEVIDLYQQPALAAKHEIIATPTLVKHVPLPVRRLIGDLSHTQDALRRLGITEAESHA